MRSSDKTLQTTHSVQTRSHVLSARIVLAVIVAVLLGVAIRFWVTPMLFALDENFQYLAEVISLDNFYDGEAKKFTGETRSVTSFGYRFVESSDDTAVVENYFDVRSVSGEKIVAIKRNYDIDRHSLAHISGAGEKNRTDYLFAPRHLQAGKAFTYWHVNYDRELELVFEAKEKINGLPTYRYSTSFGVDQTQDLTHLPDVPEARGVNLDVSLTVWVEPVTGRLIHYKDNAIAYYYDQNTGARIHPWNKFSNRFRKNSIAQQVEIAQKQKLLMLVIEQLVPLLFFIILLGFILPYQKRIKILFAVLGTASVSALFFLYVLYPSFTKDVPLKIGITRFVPRNNEIYDQNIQGFKDAFKQAGYREGENIVYLEEFPEGDLQALQSIIQKYLVEDVDLIYSLTTTGTLLVKDMVPHRPIVFSVVTFPVESGLIESLQHSGNNLVGTRNWVSSAEQLSLLRQIVPEIKTLAFVHRTGEVNSTIQLEKMRAVAKPLGLSIADVSGRNLPELQQALATVGHVDAVYSACDTLVVSEAEESIIEFAHERRLPSFSCNSTGVQKGDLAGATADFYELGNLAGEKAILVLEGASPSSLTTDTVTRPFIYINKKTADYLGIQIPQELLISTKVFITQ